MDATDFINALLEATVATSLAILLVLGSRRALRNAFGARVAYGAWVLVPVALVAVLLPAAPGPMAIAVLSSGSVVLAPARAVVAGAAMPDFRWLLVAAWLLGVVVATVVLAWRQRRFQGGLGRLHPRDEGLQADASDGLPAVMGWWRPVVVLPADFDTRYSTDQRALMLAHEHAHIARGDLHANAFVAALRCLFWFNPLLHFATRRFRHDQELACDACVVARHPGARRAYGEALLQAQFAAQGMPLGCHFGFGHPLRERVAMLGKPVPSSLRWLAGSMFVTALALGAGLAAWAAQPGPAAPAVAAADAAKLVNVRMRIDVDGKTVSTPAVINYSGRPFSVSDGRFQVEMTATARNDGRIVLVGKLYQGNHQFGEVKEELEDGKPETYDFVAPPIDGKGALLALTVDASVAPERVVLPMRRPAATALPAPPEVPVRIALVPPAYPVAAREQHIGGKVMLLVDVDIHGNVAKAVVEKSRPEGVFDAAALEAVGKWKFTPAMKDGKAVAGRIRVPIDFEPQKVATDKPADA